MQSISKRWSSDEALKRYNLMLEEHGNHLVWLRDQLDECYQHEIWVGLGFGSWSQFMKDLANKCGKSQRTLWKLHAGNVDSEPKTQNSLQSCSENADSEPETQVIPIVYDKTELKTQVPIEHPHLCKIFADCEEQSQAVLRAVYEMNAVVIANIKAEKKKDPFAAFNHADFKKHKQNIIDMIKFTRPWAVCPYCGGDGGVGGNCDPCHGRGWMQKLQWDAVPEEMQE